MTSLQGLAIAASVMAGEKILEVYNREFTIETKSDNSPLTEADKLSHKVIKQALGETGFKILSEEGRQIDYSERKNWETYWLIDPLDGTKEFIKKSGEFTVNIALIKGGVPVMGVVYAPVTGALYFGIEESGSFYCNVPAASRVDVDAILQASQKLPLHRNNNAYTIVASKSHNTPETDAFIEEKKKKYNNVNLVSAGSSIKLCLVAEGSAQVYPRLAPTMEWDTAAGHAVAKFAGCTVYDYNTKTDLIYNKENLLNPWFVVEKL
ncbi:MAG TPA: 3'(2'),5'-bisphosphate nucleotidase CysQ [Chitinophagaceae bacterium]|nr:3'(2'),5'-bisphosphate nucleotidase CysQ [Chitinophagaceae bacterium]